MPVVHGACGAACFGEGDSIVHYRDVNCSPLAQSITSCSLKLVGGSGIHENGSCGTHSRDAGVVCGKFVFTHSIHNIICLELFGSDCGKIKPKFDLTVKVYCPLLVKKGSTVINLKCKFTT